MPPQILIPVAYLAVAALVWFDFARTNPDGLANIGLILVTAPVALVGALLGAVLGADGFILMPRGFGYLNDHALYYWPSALLIALVLYRVMARVRRPPR